MKIIVIGSSYLETTCQVKEAFKEGDIVRLDNHIDCGGGIAGNVAYLLGKWGMETYIASMIGADDAANKIKKEFESVGVRTDYIETSYDKPTGHSLVLINNSNKENTTFEVMSNAYLKKYSFTVEPDIIVTDGNDHNATIAAFDRYPRAQSYLIIRRLTDEVIELSKYAKFLIFNQRCAEIVSNMKIDFNNSSTLVNVYNKLKQKYNNAEIIITLGNKGSIYSINSNVKIMPPAKFELVDTNGAGDIYAGAFIYGMANNFGLEKSIAYATIAASISTSRLSARNSMPSLNEVSNYYDGKFGAQNNPNKTIVNNFKNENPNMSTTEFSETNVNEVSNVNNNVNPNVNNNPNVMPNNNIPNNQPVNNNGNVGTN